MALVTPAAGPERGDHRSRGAGANPAIDAGVRLRGFNDDFTGAAPEIGVFETGRPLSLFGREMAPEFERAAWERY